MYGGRGSAKSYTVARILLTLGLREKRFILCSREYQNSISDSVHKLLKEQIEVLGYEDEYTVTKNEIRATNGTTFIFKGLHGSVDSIKSIPGLTDLWLEEAHTVSARSWEVLEPTIREDNSEIWVTYNPESEDDPTHVKFTGEHPPENAIIKFVNHSDNPWFSGVLKEQMEHMKRTNYELYLHVWEGQVKTSSQAKVFHGKYRIDNFEINPNWHGPYLGADWGFSQDPTAITKCYIDRVQANNPMSGRNRLLISHEAGGVGIEIIDTPALFDKIPESRSTLIRADNCRPETISHVASAGFLIRAAAKWSGSVEDGIAWLKSFDEIVIHERCVKTAEEFRKYSYKVDRLTGDITVKIVDDFNHYIDSIRYALEPMIVRKKQGILGVV